MIKLEHISKTFGDTGDGVHAVKDVSLEIGDGEIFGIIGFSGAGKSTLVRCINLLERPTSGSITVNGQKLTWMEKQADGKSCRVIVPDDQLSLAIGKEGQNARLAAKLTGCKIDIKPASQVAAQEEPAEAAEEKQEQEQEPEQGQGQQE